MGAAKSATIYGSRDSIWSAKFISFRLALASFRSLSLKISEILLLLLEDSITSSGDELLLEGNATDDVKTEGYPFEEFIIVGNIIIAENVPIVCSEQIRQARCRVGESAESCCALNLIVNAKLWPIKRDLISLSRCQGD